MNRTDLLKWFSTVHIRKGLLCFCQADTDSSSRRTIIYAFAQKIKILVLNFGTTSDGMLLTNTSYFLLLYLLHSSIFCQNSIGCQSCNGANGESSLLVLNRLQSYFHHFRGLKRDRRLRFRVHAAGTELTFMRQLPPMMDPLIPIMQHKSIFHETLLGSSTSFKPHICNM